MEYNIIKSEGKVKHVLCLILSSLQADGTILKLEKDLYCNRWYEFSVYSYEYHDMNIVKGKLIAFGSYSNTDNIDYIILDNSYDRHSCKKKINIHDIKCVKELENL